MPTLSESRFAQLLEPYLLCPLPGRLPTATGSLGNLAFDELYPKLSEYLDLLLRWNLRTNLTSVRDPDSIVRRHFGESLFAARVLATLLPQEVDVLDFGSGAGFPGLPIQLFLPQTRVTLAESQRKKVAFLREAIRVTGAVADVWPGRVEEMSPDRKFDAVTMRAVDNSDVANRVAHARVRSGGWLLSLVATGTDTASELKIPGIGSGSLRVEQKG